MPIAIPEASVFSDVDAVFFRIPAKHLKHIRNPQHEGASKQGPARLLS